MFLTDAYLPYLGIATCNAVTIATLGLFLSAFGRSKCYPETEKALNIWYLFFIYNIY